MATKKELEESLNLAEITIRNMREEIALLKDKLEDLKPKEKTILDFKSCNIEGCDNKVEAKGLCKKHYSINRRTIQPIGKCQIKGCGDALEALGMCTNHYQQARRFFRSNGEKPNWQPDTQTKRKLPRIPKHRAIPDDLGDREETGDEN